MSAQRTDMHRLQEVVRLARMGHSQRRIARQMQMGRDTIRTYLDACSKAGLLEGEPDALPGLDQLRAAVEASNGEAASAPAPAHTSSVEAWREKIVELRSHGAGPTAIHDHLRLQHTGQYTGSLSAVKRMCRRLDREAGPSAEDVAIPVQTPPGEIAQVDFGYAGERYDPEQGVLRKAWVFVMTLGFSRHMHADLVFDQKAETWLQLHVDAFEALGGVPRVVVPDNLKAAVIRAAFGVDDAAVLHRSYRELAQHYGCQIDPTPPRDPAKKGKVEASVKYIKQNFLATHQTVDIHEDRRQLQRWLSEIAGQRQHGSHRQRPAELFEQVERQTLLPLPATRWEQVVWKQAKLHRDSHVQVDAAFYSAPWKLIGERLWVRSTPHRVTLYDGDERLWTHPRVRRGQRSTVDSHLPEHRGELRHRTREYWVERAHVLGDEVRELVEAIFDADDVLLSLRTVQAVVKHLEQFPGHRARAAARRAVYYGLMHFQGIKNILRKGLDLQPLNEGEPKRAWSQGSRFARTPTLFTGDPCNDHQ